VVTSGLGGVFPKGMAVGRIVGFRKDPMRMLAQAIVRPHQDLHSFEEAMIMLKQDQRVLIGKGYANVGTTDTLR
jgi:rod shape-determining protein MreC